MYCWVKEITGVTNTLATLGDPWVEYDTCLITAVKVHLTPRELHTANRMLGEGLHWDKNVCGKPAKPYDCTKQCYDITLGQSYERFITLAMLLRKLCTAKVMVL